MTVANAPPQTAICMGRWAAILHAQDLWLQRSRDGRPLPVCLRAKGLEGILAQSRRSARARAVSMTPGDRCLRPQSPGPSEMRPALRVLTPRGQDKAVRCPDPSTTSASSNRRRTSSVDFSVPPISRQERSRAIVPVIHRIHRLRRSSSAALQERKTRGNASRRRGRGKLVHHPSGRVKRRNRYLLPTSSSDVT
jgi:hypothetical protein